MFEQIGIAANFVLAPLTLFPPYLALLILSIILTLLIIGINRLITNKNYIKEIKNKMNEIKENLTKAQREGNKESINKFLSELMKTNSEYMKYSFRTLIVSVVIIFFFLPWAQYTYSGKTVAFLPFSLPFIGSNLTWLYWYILVSFAVGWVIRKVFDLE